MTDHGTGPRGTEETNTTPRGPADSPHYRNSSRAYAFAAGGPGWDAPGWRVTDPEPAKPKGFARYLPLLAAGLVGAILGGLLVGTLVHPWRDDRDSFRVELNQQGPGMPRNCVRTEMGFRCEFPR